MSCSRIQNGAEETTPSNPVQTPTPAHPNIPNCRNVADLAHLKAHRHKIGVEAREIVHRLDIANPNWCAPN
jgi:hypothetical protein